jgi:hypothetical protein
MKPYITGIDRTNPIGKIVGDYGEYQWNKGFMTGIFTGICVGGILVWAARRPKS